MSCSEFVTHCPHRFDAKLLKIHQDCKPKPNPLQWLHHSPEILTSYMALSTERQT